MANGNSSLIQNLDKIAYAAAAVLALIVLALPVFSGTELRNAVRAVDTNVKKIVEKPKDVPDMPVPDVKGEIEKQWKLASTRRPSTWSTHRRQSFIQFLKAGETEYVAHESDPVVEQIQYLRNAEKRQTYVKVTGSLGKINFVDSGAFVAAALERREGEAGEFMSVPGFSTDAALATGKFEYDDYGVAVGKLYAYRVSSTLKVKPGAANTKVKADDATKTSVELAMTASVPYDYSLDIINIQPFDPQTGKEGSFFGTIKFAKFEDGSVEAINNAEFKKLDEFGPPVDGKKKMWQILRVKADTVEVRDARARKKKSHSLATNNDAVALPEPVLAPEPVPETEGEEGDVEADVDLLKGDEGEVGTTTASGTPEPAEPAPTPKKKKRRFGK